MNCNHNWHLVERRMITPVIEKRFPLLGKKEVYDYDNQFYEYEFVCDICLERKIKRDKESK